MNKLFNIFLFLCLVQGIWAQEYLITGSVKSEDNQVIPGAIIKVNNSNTGTITDDQGLFSILVKNNATLTVSYVGYQPQEIPLKDEKMLNIILMDDTKLLNEIIVTGYGSQSKRDVTGSISKINSEQIEDLHVRTLEQILKGNSAGVLVNSGSGKLGQSANITIRGSSSISASNNPLYVVDGIPLYTDDLSYLRGGSTSGLVNLNPEDIATVEILKDAAAAAIYGSRASNGVVIITTKKGQEGRTNIHFGMQFGNSKPTHIVDFLNTAQYVDYYTKAAANSDRIDGLDPTSPDSYTSYIKSFFDYISLGTYGTDKQADTPWEELPYQNAAQTQYDFSIDGGNAKTKYYFSGQSLDQKGILVNNSLQRYSGRIALDHQANKYFNVGANFSLSRTFTKRLSSDGYFDNPQQIIALTPLTPEYDPSTGLRVGTPPGDITVPLYYNPLINIDNSKFNTTTIRNLSSIYGVLHFNKSLSLRSELGIDLIDQDEELYYNSKTQRNDQYTLGHGTNRFYRIENYNTNNYLTWNKNFNIHDINFILGYGYQQSDASLHSVDGADFPSDAYKKLKTAARFIGGNSEASNYSFVSYFSRINYKLYNRYLLGLSGRVDGSSRFGSDQRYGFFPAASIAWILSDESFLENNATISFLKLRSSLGKTGNAEIGNLKHLGLFAGDAGYGEKPGQRPSQLANPDLHWETTNQSDIGVDVGLWHDRITLNFDLYQKKTSGLLLEVNVPATSGFSTVFKNVGSLTNKGIELTCNVNIVHRKSFLWNLGLQFAANKNKVLDVQDQVIQQAQSRVEEGYSLYSFYVPEYAGVDPSNGDALWYKNIKNADGSIDHSTTNDYAQAERIIIGNALPKWTGGLNTSLSYKNFELSALVNTVQGNLINTFGVGQFSSANGRYEDNQTVDQLNSWTVQNPNTDIPEARLYYTNGAQESSRFLKDGSYIRLQNVDLSYNFAAAWLNKLKIVNATVFVSGINLLTITDYPYWDPEVESDAYGTFKATRGNDFYTPPQAKTFLGGFKIQF